MGVVFSISRLRLSTCVQGEWYCDYGFAFEVLTCLLDFGARLCWTGPDFFFSFFFPLPRFCFLFGFSVLL